ncbi:MAG: hypothetical protein AB7V26_12840 [Lysobacterales bacterium]
MAIVLFAVLIALLVGHSLPDLARLRAYHWFEHWLAWCHRQGALLAGGRAALVLALILPLLPLAALQWLLRGEWFGLPSFALATLFLLYSLGPRDLDQDVDAVALAVAGENRSESLQQLPEEPPNPPLPVNAEVMVDQVMLAALARWFGVVFWFVVLGATGALAFRLLCLACGSARFRQYLSADQIDTARTLRGLAEWPAAQLMTLALALAADFDAVASAWRDFHGNHALGWFSMQPGYLTAAARASVDLDADGESGSDAEHAAVNAMQQAMSLVWRMLVVWLAALSLLVLAGKIG